MKFFSQNKSELIRKFNDVVNTKFWFWSQHDFKNLFFFDRNKKLKNSANGLMPING